MLLEELVSSVPSDIGMKAIDVGTIAAIGGGKKLVEKAAKRLATSKPQVDNVMVPQEEIIKKVNEVIAKYADKSAINLNKLIDGSSIIVQMLPTQLQFKIS